MNNTRALREMEECLEKFFEGDENTSHIVSFYRHPHTGDLRMRLCASEIDQDVEINLTFLAEFILKLPVKAG